MNRNYLRALSSLLRQAAAVADTSALPSSCRFTLPASAACLQSLANNTNAPSERFTKILHASSPTFGNFQSRHLTTDATAVWENVALERLEIRGADDNLVEDLLESPDFLEAIDFLQERLGKDMSRPEILRQLAKISLTGYSSEGHPYTRTSPNIPLIESTLKPRLEYLQAIPGINLARVIRNAPYLFLEYDIDMAQIKDNKTWLETTLELRGEDLGHVISLNGYVLIRSIEKMEENLELLDELGFTRSQQGKMVQRNPRLLALRSSRMKQALNHYKERGFSDDQIKKIFWKFPAACE